MASWAVRASAALRQPSLLCWVDGGPVTPYCVAECPAPACLIAQADEAALGNIRPTCRPLRVSWLNWVSSTFSWPSASRAMSPMVKRRMPFASSARICNSAQRASSDSDRVWLASLLSAAPRLLGLVEVSTTLWRGEGSGRSSSVPRPLRWWRVVAATLYCWQPVAAYQISTRASAPNSRTISGRKRRGAANMSRDIRAS